MTRLVLRSPRFIRNAAASRAADPEERWLLRQPRAVREDFVRHVLDPGGNDDLLAEIWMLRQSDAVRESYVREVLEPRLDGR